MYGHKFEKRVSAVVEFWIYLYDFSKNITNRLLYAISNLDPSKEFKKK